MFRVLVIIPCYNEEKNIENVVSNIMSIVDNSSQSLFCLDYIIINDSSKDSTLDVCVRNGYNYLNLPVNLGIGGCVQAGYRFAFDYGYDIAIQHDGDGQHDPSFFSDVIAPIVSGDADIVIGSRFLERRGFQSTGLRRLGISFLRAIIRLCSGVKVLDVTSGYRAANKKFIELFAGQYAQDYPEPESIVDAIRHGARIVEVPVVMRERMEGKSSISALKSLHYMIKVSLSILLHKLIIPKSKKELL
jgi:glycosyltransferase involved in cell wall biosynthesis